MKSKFIKIWNKFKALLKQGLTPKQLAISLVVSTLVSIFPIFGITTIALTCIALPFRLNLPIMIAFSYIVGPIKFLVLIPFINIGAYVFGTEHTLLTFEAIKTSYETSFFDTAKALSYELLCGTVGWLLTAIPLGIGLYFILKGILTHFDKLKINRLTTK
ncbi:DUF2062 domain-containing protein [Winogradskyella immobilis]|uniref:DUF2062 domain-containing protein n=1 Tax=Winogradskyella immobilis TaxID=2816852 RepID=A0ABS8EIX5_9FLAO|nr:DUF2062 domain-containing protein [Winogradskyella immobilis]MCC1483158.1 DUF2062 domain-containing protein [Winogradskyella immobilis]MCG0015253.1 DUF2062 domain-containing protein [Winogradskyella immobilis]